jgi:hypothetical protein
MIFAAEGGKKMSDLISREAAIAAVERREKYLIGDKRIDVESVKNFLRNRPTVEAEPVRHGRWIAQDDTFTRFRCSVCELKNYDGYGKYCPNCGAKMDGDTT